MQKSEMEMCRKVMDNKKSRKDALTGMKYLHLIITVGLFVLFWIQFRYHGQLPVWGRPVRYDFYLVIGYAFISYYFMKTYNAYMIGHFRIRELAFSQTLSNVLSIFIVYFGTAIAWWQWHNPILIVPLLIAQAVINLGWSYFANSRYESLYPPLKAIVIYRTDFDLKQIENLKGKATDRTYNLAEYYQYKGYDKENINSITEIIDQYDAVFVTGVGSKMRNSIAKYCAITGKLGYFVPRIGDLVMASGEHVQSLSSPVLSVSRKHNRREYLLLKRLIDILCSALGLIILSPLLIIVGLIIKLEDHGPAFYRQTRLTKDGRTFELLKFRSMRVDAEADGVARLSTGDNDDRITKIGRFIRATRIDEFPQLINIIKGDMTIVGPRPERPEIADQYTKEIPEFPLRLQVTAGLTGYAQVYGKYNTTPYEKLEFDLMYINNMNLLTDFQLMFATARVIFSKESTEGIDEGSTTANN